MADIDDAPDGGTPTGGTPAKKKATPAGKYKAMVKKPAQDTTQMLMVEKADGSVGPWGNDIPPAKKQQPPTKPAPKLSDKALGYSSNYYPPNH